MVRTRADAGATRAAGAKAPRKNLGGTSSMNYSNSPGDKGKGREYSGGNSYCPRETPNWQKPITSFFNRPNDSGESTKSNREMEFVNPDSATSPAASSTSGESTSKEGSTAQGLRKSFEQ